MLQYAINRRSTGPFCNGAARAPGSPRRTMTDHEAPGPAQPEPSTLSTSCAYAEFVAERVAARAGELGRSWVQRGAASLGSAAEPPEVADVAAVPQRAEEIVQTLAAAAAGGRHWHEQTMRTGWQSGADALRRGSSLNELLKELDGGVALVLNEVGAATEAWPGPATAADGIALARRIADAASFLRLAAAGGYSRGMADEMRNRYRTIRHDLRNPLGTITTAVALMDDESVPEATRQHPRVRAMVARNARSMEAMIAATLGDPAARIPAIAMQTTSIMALACAVKADLNAAVESIEVAVADDLPRFPFDSTGLELLLKAVVIAISRAAERTSRVEIGLANLAPDRATLSVRSGDQGSSRSGGAVETGFARELAAHLGARLTVLGDTHVQLDIPVTRIAQADGPGTTAPLADRRERRSAPDARDDVARGGEGVHGEAGSL